MGTGKSPNPKLAWLRRWVAPCSTGPFLPMPNTIIRAHGTVWKQWIKSGGTRGIFRTQFALRPARFQSQNNLVKGNLVWNLPTHGRMFRGSLVNHVILMSASSCQQLGNKSGSEQWKGVTARNSPYNKFFLRGIVFLWRKNMVWIKECQGSVAAWKQNQTA